MTMFAVCLFTFAVALCALAAWFFRRAAPFAHQITSERAAAQALRDQAEHLVRNAQQRQREALDVLLVARALTDRAAAKLPPFHPSTFSPSCTAEERFFLDLLRGYDYALVGSELLSAGLSHRAIEHVIDEADDADLRRLELSFS